MNPQNINRYASSCPPLAVSFLRRSRLLSVASAVATVLFTSNLQATDYYVDSVAGLDTNNGTTTATPWKSLAKVNGSTFVGGDNIFFKRGSAWSGTLIPPGVGTSSTNRVTYDAYGTGPNPVIDGAGARETVMMWSKNYFTFQNFTITNVAVNEGYRMGMHISFVGVKAPSSVTHFYDVKILNNEIHHVAGSTRRTAALYDTGAIYVNFSDYQGAQTHVDGLLIEGNDIYENRCIGIHTKAPGTYGTREDLWATNLVIRNNLIDQGGADHIVINGAKGFLVESNAGYDAGIIGSGYIAIAGMWSAYHTREATFQYNEVARTRNEFVNGDDGDSQAFDADWGTRGEHIFQYNYSHDNEGGCLIMMYEAYPKTVVYRYNLSVNDGRNTNGACQFGVSPIEGTNSVHIYNNVFYSNRQEGFRLRPNPASFFYNNIFYMPAAIYPDKTVFSNNCYFGHTPNVTDHYKVLADPKFVGPLPAGPAGDGQFAAHTDIFKLQATSPCINAGKSITTPISNGGFDYWGNPLYTGGYADIGAHEVLNGSGAAPAAVTITDNPPSGTVTYNGAGWTHSADPIWYNSTKSASNVIGQYVQFSFTGTNVSIFGKTGTGLGKMNVSIDGGAPVLVDCYWPYDMWHRELFQISGLSNGPHTIRATIAAKNPASTYNAIGIDYFLQAPGTPTSNPVVNRVDGAASASVVYTGAWTHQTADATRYAGTRSYSGTIGDYVEHTFTGTGVRIYCAKAYTQGKLSVSVDGGPAAIVNCYQGTDPDYQVPVYQIHGLAAGAHTVRATIATKDPASAGNNVSVDFFEALSGGYSPMPTTIDNPASDSVSFSGAWVHSADVGYYNATKSVSNTIGNSVTFQFTGSGVALYAKKDPNIGKLSIQIDGGAATIVDCYNPGSVIMKAKVFELTGLPPGSHTLKATVALKNPASTGNWIGIDYITCLP